MAESRDKHRRYREANREKVREQNRRYREANREKVRESSRRHKARNPEAVLEYGRQHREANREEQNARVREWASRPENRARHQATSLARQRKLRDLVPASTARKGFWTPAEDSIVMRDDITLSQVAVMLQRTYSACALRRKRLRKAGLLTPGS